MKKLKLPSFLFYFILIFNIFFISNAYAVTTQGFTVSSVSLTNILHPGDPASKTQWLIQLSLNGGGQSLVGTLDNSTINYQGLTSVYPLQISGSTDPEEAFYIINNANPDPIYTFSSQTQIGSITDYIVYVSATPAPSCSGQTYEWDVNLPSGWFGLSSSVTVVRICIYRQQIASEASIPSTPNIQFSSHISLTANYQQESLDLSYNQQSATSSRGSVQANWIGSLITGNAPPDGSKYVAINNPQSNAWNIQNSYDFQNWKSKYSDTDNMLRIIGTYTPNTLPNPCSSIQQAKNNQYLSSVSTCMNNLAQTDFSQNNQYANNLLGSSSMIDGSYPQFTNYQSQTAFKIPLMNYFITNPVVVLRVSGSFIGVVIPLGKPQIISASSDCFHSGDTGTIKIQVKNIGNARGSFYVSLKDCPGMDLRTQPNYAVDVGQTSNIEAQIYSTGTNQNINQQCQVEITDYNGGGSDNSYVGICMKQANQCNPDSITVEGNSICSCININGIWQLATGNQCTTCPNGVISDDKGGWKCASNPNPQTENCPQGQVFSKDTSTCVDPSQLIGYPADSSCQSGWPSHQGSIVSINEKNNACDLFEVKNSQLLSIAQEAAYCFSKQCLSDKCHAFCAVAYTQSGAAYIKDSDVFKKFAGLYLIYGLGPAAKFMQGYFDAEIECSFGTGACEPKNGYNSFVQQLQCKGPVGHPEGWVSDTDMSQNSCLFSDLPAHADVNILQTGTCVDYSVSLTTLLRYVGYNNNEVYSVTAPCHEYNLVKFPGDAMWTIVDTVGNSPAPLGDTWSWDCGGHTTHCDFYENSCSNDNGQVNCPSKSEVKGC